MTAQETAELAALERAIRSLEPLAASQGLRSALRSDLARAAAARRPFGLGAFVAPVPRVAFAALAALLLITSGWAVAASAPGDLVYPIKNAIVRLVLRPASDDLRVPPLRELPELPPATLAPASPGSDLSQPSTAGGRIEAPVPSEIPQASNDPVVAPTASIVPEVQAPAPTPGGASATASAAPARAIPAIPPYPPGPRATPAIPPEHR